MIVRARWASTVVYWHKLQVPDDASDDEIEKLIADAGFDSSADDNDVVEEWVESWEVIT